MLTPACLSRPTGRTLVCAGLFLLALTSSTTPSISCPHPDDLVVTGPERKKALEQLQASVNRCLSLKIDELSGNVICERNKKPNGQFVSLTREGKRLAEVIADNTVLVNIIASDSMVTSAKKLSFGGSYLGNSFTGTYGYTDDPAVKVPVIATRQQVDPETARMISDYYGKPGADMLHEIIESYLGGKYAQQKKIADTSFKFWAGALVVSLLSGLYKLKQVQARVEMLKRNAKLVKASTSEKDAQRAADLKFQEKTLHK